MKVIQAFDRHAATYETHATVQKQVAQRLLEHLLSGIPEPLQVYEILELGCGTGGFSERVHQTFPQARLTLLDASEAMLQQAAQKNWSTSALMVRASAEHYQPEQRFDLVVSNCAAQWFQDPVQDLRRYLQHLNPGGSLVFAVFVKGTLQEWHQCLNAVYLRKGLPVQVHQQGHLELADWKTWAGLSCVTDQWTLTYRDARTALRAIQMTGAAGTKVSPPISILREALREYDRRYPEGVPVTYRALFAQVRA